jgi:CRP-like cAMP-binding protein/Fe-S-cluster-containing hydrogenase component 2
MISRSIDVPSVRSIDARIAALQQLDSLQHTPVSELALLAQYATLRAFEPGTTIFNQHDPARHLYIVLNGHVEQLAHDQHGSAVTLALLGRGDLFGEGGLFGLRHRRTTVCPTNRTIVLQYRYADLQAYQAQLPIVFAALRLRFRERLLHTTLARVPLLAALTPLERFALAEQLDDRRVERGALLIKAGETGDGLYILADGQACVRRNAQTLAVIEPGDMFGEMSLIEDTPHEATIEALTPVHLLFLPRAACDRFLTEHPEIVAGLGRLITERRTSDRTAEHIATTERLIATGIVRGNVALVRQADRCAPDCHRCQDACASRFGVARLQFSGTTFGALEAADVCRQCRWGAECVEACPEDAIRPNQQGQLVITDRCTGCGACIVACPYDAVNQAPVYTPAPHLLARLARHVVKPQPIMLRANKCDGCADYQDAACITACPTGALQWRPVADLYSGTSAPIQLVPKQGT